MPKRKNPPGSVEDTDELDRILALENTPLPTDLSAQINILGDYATQAVIGQLYIQDNLARLRGAFTPLTPSQAANQLGAMAARLNTRMNTQTALRQQLINFANRVVLPRDGGEFTGNGKCYMQFVNVGLGDCTLITTPKGVKIMIDCGSDALSDVTSLIPHYNILVNGTPEVIIRNSINSQTFLNSTTAIDILILSHPDADHHNKLEDILGLIANFKVNILYYGGANNIEAFTSSAYIKGVAGTTTSNLRKVVLREEATLNNHGNIIVTKTINDVALGVVAGKANTIGDEFVGATSGEIVLYYEDGASNFRLSVLASNVTGVWKDDEFVTNDADIKTAGEMKLNATEPNKRSLVAMMRCFGQQALICGDATALTENFMLDYFADSLALVQTLRLGHHGSATSSCEGFIDELSAMSRAVASSSGQTTTLHSLPKQRILDLYPPKLPATATAHTIWAFASGDAIAQDNYFNGITTQLYTTGSNDTIGYAIPKPNMDISQGPF